MTLGYDEIIVTTDNIVDLLRQLREQSLIIINLRQIDQNTFRFYVPIYLRYITKKCHLTIYRSVGILHYLLLLCQINHLFLTISFAITLMILPQFILDVQIEGYNRQVNQEITDYLQKNHIHRFQKSLDYKDIDKLYEQIKDRYIDKIDYLNIYQNGSVLHIQYTNVVSSYETKEDYQNIIAKCDGVIKEINIARGNILVKVNDYVKKGDILVSNTIEATDGKTKIVPTYGVIKAYTYHCYTSEMDSRKMSKEDAFSYLLFKTRQALPSNVKIDKEKVLSYDIIDKKLVLKMQYVFIEEISMKENQ